MTNQQNTTSSADALACYERGLQAFKQRNIGQAIVYFEKAIAQKLEKADLYFQYAQAKLALGLKKDVLADYTKAIELDPQEGEYHAWRANDYASHGEWKKSLEDYKTYMELQIAQGKDLLYIEHHVFEPYEEEHGEGFVPRELVLEYLNKAVEKYPSNAYYWDLRGMTFSQLEQPQKAMECWQKSMQLFIEQGQPFHYGYAWGYADFSTEQCKEFIAQALKRWPDKAEYQKLQQNYFADTPRVSPAERQAAQLAKQEAAVAAAPTAENYYQRAQAYLAAQQPEKALADLEKAFALSENTPLRYTLYTPLAEMYEKNGQYKQAIQIMKACLHQAYEDMLNHTEYLPEGDWFNWTNKTIHYDLTYLISLYLKAGRPAKEIIDTIFAATPYQGFEMCQYALARGGSQEDINKANAFFEENAALYPQQEQTDARKDLLGWLAALEQEK